jgi:hypothetical protein
MGLGGPPLDLRKAEGVGHGWLIFALWQRYRAHFHECPPMMAILGHDEDDGRIEMLMADALKTGKRLTPHQLWRAYGMTPPPKGCLW